MNVLNNMYHMELTITTEARARARARTAQDDLIDEIRFPRAQVKRSVVPLDTLKLSLIANGSHRVSENMLIDSCLNPDTTFDDMLSFLNANGDWKVSQDTPGKILQEVCRMRQDVSVEAVRALITAYPSALSYKDVRKQLPVFTASEPVGNTFIRTTKKAAKGKSQSIELLRLLAVESFNQNYHSDYSTSRGGLVVISSDLDEFSWACRPVQYIAAHEDTEQALDLIKELFDRSILLPAHIDGCKLLHMAASANNLPLIMFLLEIDPTAIFEIAGVTPLHFACEKKNEVLDQDLVIFLIEMGIELNIPQGGLTSYAAWDHGECVPLIDIVPKEGGEEVLTWARNAQLIPRDCVQTFELLFDASLPASRILLEIAPEAVKHKNREANKLPLYYARCPEQFRLYLEAGINLKIGGFFNPHGGLEARTHNLDSPLHNIVRDGEDAAVCDLLIWMMDKKLLKKSFVVQQNLLHASVYGMNLETTKYLIALDGSAIGQLDGEGVLPITSWFNGIFTQERSDEVQLALLRLLVSESLKLKVISKDDNFGLLGKTGSGVPCIWKTPIFFLFTPQNEYSTFRMVLHCYKSSPLPKDYATIERIWEIMGAMEDIYGMNRDDLMKLAMGKANHTVYKLIVEEYNYGTHKDKDGRLLLHFAAELGAGWNELLSLLVTQNKLALQTKDPLTGLYPFALAARRGRTSSLDSTYRMLRQDPYVLEWSNPSNL